MKKEVEKKIKESIDAHLLAVAEFKTGSLGEVMRAVDMIVKSLKRKGCVYVCGNGGSAADAQYIAGEFVGRCERDRRALLAVAITTDTTVLTAIANDFGYENVFERQVEALVKMGDILWAISTSVTFPNVIKSVKMAKKKGARILVFTGKENTELEKLSDVCISAKNVSTARGQEIHMMAYHIICGLVEDHLISN